MKGRVAVRLSRPIVACVLMCLAACGGGGNPAAPQATPSFALPASVRVLTLPYPSIDAAMADEPNVDWNDVNRARAVTLSFAAREIHDHLAMSGIDAPLQSGLPGETGPTILVLTRDQLAALQAAGIEVPALPTPSGDDSFVIATSRDRLFIVGASRAGALHGTYRWLESLGFAWDDPHETIAPAADTLRARRAWPRIEGAAAVGLRGFWIYGRTLPDEFALWMARNGFNVSAPVDSPTLQRRLSLQGWAGEHNLIQEEFSAPGLFDQHPDWFALIDGVRRPVAPSGNYYNPAFVNDAAANYFADRMLARLQGGDLANVDLLNVWPTDDRFNRFDQSPEALAIGNETDNLLKFYSVVAHRLDVAFDSGQLSRRVRLAGISYYLTMRPPTNSAVVDALRQTDYVHLFYPITRSWNGPIAPSANDSDANRQLLDDLAGWQLLAPLRYGVVEYHNQSIYGAVALTDELYLATNYEFLTDHRNALYATMHALDGNPGPRRLTNLLHGHLGWQEAVGPYALSRVALADRLTANYFERRYGNLAAEWRHVYELMTRSTENAQEIFGSNSLHMVLFQDLIWSPPFFSRAEAAGFIPMYRLGGSQELPAAFSGGTTMHANFRGLDSSLALQAEARDIWTRIVSFSMPAEIRMRIESDVSWFEGTASRYRLMAATCDYVAAELAGNDLTGARSRIAEEIAIIEALAPLGGTLSPVDQFQFLALHRARAGL